MVNARQSAAGTLGAKRCKKRPFYFGRGKPGKQRAPSLPKEKPEKARKLKPLLKLEPRECRWPIGDPLKPGFGFCGERTEIGKSYCKEHMARAYVPADRQVRKLALLRLPTVTPAERSD